MSFGIFCTIKVFRGNLHKNCQNMGIHEYIGGGGGVQYTGWGYHEYIGGYSVHQRDTKGTSGGHHDSCGGAN